ncbi:type II secretion system protein GspC [Glaciecola sp. MH2013]|uniref:type II secretion system protein GspC n=1 Tax=Glaciecola sp. MH2013 TaxID=2785524 RepID=UPI00189F01C8|nr:type II secretion system protein GspC [Glaciecola sp. MH2013]MBF7074351.1 type II secretion system protein GspC [Glaciecola sp. MH2013]
MTANLSVQSLTKTYHLHQGKLILAVVVLLSLYLLAFAAELTWRILPQPESKAANVYNANTNTSRSNSARLDISPLTRINLFGNPEAKPVVEETEITEAPETKLNLTLTGVVSSTDPKIGAAIIENAGKQNTYGVGEKIDGTNATLDELYVDRVIIKNRMARETLMLDGIDFDEANQQREQRQQNSQAAVQGPVLGNSASERVKEARAKLKDSPASFTDYMSIRPHAPQGELVGYQVSPGKEPEFFNELGLRSGDVITDINGIDLTDPQQAFEAINILREAQELQLEILRGDEAISLDIEIPSSDE